MIVEFRKLIIRNFMPFRKLIVPLAHQGVVRVEGLNKDEPGADSNMAGKSAIMEALVWCLYGRTIRGLKHDAVVNRWRHRGCHVGVFFDCNGVKYRVSRYRRDRTYRNQLQLWRGSRLLSSRHETETQAKLESILGCDYQTFANTTIFDGKNPFALLTDAAQKKILESFLHFEKFETALHLTRDRLTEARNTQHKLQLRQAKLQGEVTTIRAQLKTLRSSETILARRAKTELQEIKRKLDDLKEPKPGPTRKKLEKAESRLMHLEEKRARVRASIHTARAMLKRLRNEFHDKEKLTGRRCHVCGQRVTLRSVKALQKHLAADREAARQTLAGARVRVVSLEKEVTHAREYLKRVQHLKQQSTLSIKGYITCRRDLEHQVRVSSSYPHAQPSPFTRKLERLSILYSRKLSRLLLCEYEARELVTHIDDLTFWETGFGNRGVKALVVRQALPTLNVKLREYAQEIFKGGVELQFSPSTTTKQGEERELFHLHYKSRHGASSYLGESAGGRRRVDICVLLVFSWLSRTCNLLLVDELLDGLDESGQEAILQILSRLRGTVLVISHARHLKTKLGQVWVVTKHNKISTLERAA